MQETLTPQLNVDLDYQLEHFVSGPLLPDMKYLYKRISEETVAVVNSEPPGSVVDVGSGGSRELIRLAQLGWNAIAVDPSAHMLGVSRLLEEETGARITLVRSIGEQLPFDDGSIDVVATQCALDHFSDRFAFMREAARIVKPTGRVIVSLNNFEGLACRLGRALHPTMKATRLHHCADWPCWDIPPDHTFKGDWDVVRALGGTALRLDRAYGVSMLCMLYGWGHLLHRLPEGMARRLLRGADRIAYGRPSLSDVIFSVWRPVPSSSAAS
jgi:SAM-dependent methyltransferase